MNDSCHSIDCAAAMRQLFDYLDDELTEERMHLVQAHLDLCARCYPHYNFQKIFLEAIAATRQQCCAPGALRAKVLRGLQEAGFSGSQPNEGSRKNDLP